VLTVHHLQTSQSERIVWLCEELGIAYQLKRYLRDPVTRLPPHDLKSLHPMGLAPVITDRNLVLGESAAIADYLIHRHGGGRLAVSVSDPGYADYLYWFHFANGSLQPTLGRLLGLRRLNLSDDHPVVAPSRTRLAAALHMLEARLAVQPWLAGAQFTAAEVMTGFSLTTMRMFEPVDLSPYPHILSWLGRIGERPAYLRALELAEPGMVPALRATTR
jgi:glutathione S-transferase